jgi:starvation-inducible DNA-binding protein
MSDGKPRQAFGGTRANPIGCDANALKPVIQALNETLCTHGALDHQYRKHHWLVRGPQWRDLHQHLHDAYAQVQVDMDDIAERIVMLGGMPECHPARQVERSTFAFETETHLPIRSNLENDQAAEMLLCQQLRRCIHTALDVHDYGTETLLKGVLCHAEQRADDLDHLLDADSLETRQAQQPRKAA